MKTLIIIIILIIVVGLGYYFYNAANGPITDEMPLNSGENPRPGDQIHNLPVEPAAAAARKDLAATLNVPESTIVIMLVEDKTWNDGCLGLGQAHESCLMALVPGFRVELVSKGKTYVYRTDKSGASVRAETI